MMDPTRIDLSAISSRFIAENSEIPTDITFKFSEAATDEETVAAHKMILGMVSKIFRNMFFVHNTLDRTAIEMLLEDTTKKPFQIMIDAIYEVKPMKEILQGKSLHEVFAVLYLVTKYEIYQLELAVKECISSFPITNDTVLQIAADADTYSSSFEEAVQSILLRCAQFLKLKLTDSESVVRFVAENGDRIDLVYKLLVLMNDMDDMPPADTCSTCQHGVGVEANQFKKRLKVSHNPAIQKITPSSPGFWGYSIKDYIGEVVSSVDADDVEVKYRMWVKKGGNLSGRSTYDEYYHKKSTFLSYCK